MEGICSKAANWICHFPWRRCKCGHEIRTLGRELLQVSLSAIKNPQQTLLKKDPAKSRCSWTWSWAACFTLLCVTKGKCSCVRPSGGWGCFWQLCFVQDLSPHTTQTLQEGVLGCAWNHRAAWLGGDPQTGHVLVPIKITLKFRRYIYELAAFSLPLYARPTNGVPSLTEQHILVFSDRPRIHSQTSTDISVACLSLY